MSACTAGAAVLFIIIFFFQIWWPAFQCRSVAHKPAPLTRHTPKADLLAMVFGGGSVADLRVDVHAVQGVADSKSGALVAAAAGLGVAHRALTRLVLTVHKRKSPSSSTRTRPRAVALCMRHGKPTKLNAKVLWAFGYLALSHQPRLSGARLCSHLWFWFSLAATDQGHDGRPLLRAEVFRNSPHARTRRRLVFVLGGVYVGVGRHVDRP